MTLLSSKADADRFATEQRRFGLGLTAPSGLPPFGTHPATIERSVQVRVDPADLDAVRATLRSFIAAGATHLILNLVAPYPPGIVQRLADEVASPLRAEHEGRAQP
jgi:hypothetical protein